MWWSAFLAWRDLLSFFRRSWVPLLSRWWVFWARDRSVPSVPLPTSFWENYLRFFGQMGFGDTIPEDLRTRRWRSKKLVQQPKLLQRVRPQSFLSSPWRPIRVDFPLGVPRQLRELHVRSYKQEFILQLFLHGFQHQKRRQVRLKWSPSFYSWQSLCFFSYLMTK